MCDRVVCAYAGSQFALPVLLSEEASFGLDGKGEEKGEAVARLVGLTQLPYGATLVLVQTSGYLMLSKRGVSDATCIAVAGVVTATSTACARDRSPAAPRRPSRPMPPYVLLVCVHVYTRLKHTAHRYSVASCSHPRGSCFYFATRTWHILGLYVLHGSGMGLFSHLIPSHPISSHLISSHPISSLSSHPSHLISSLLIFTGTYSTAPGWASSSVPT
jgi:hypothetical protein